MNIKFKKPATSVAEALMGMAVLAVLFVFLIPLFRPHTPAVPTSAFFVSPTLGTFVSDGNQLSCKEIRTADEFENIKDDLNASYCLMNDINLKDKNWTGISGFNGKLYGNGRVIYNLNAKQGIFSSLASKALVMDFGIHNSKITYTSGDQGFIAGTTASGAIIMNVYAADSVMDTGEGSKGGLVGTNNGQIIYAYSAANIQCHGTAGGLAGTNNGTIVESYASGDIFSYGSNVGGFVGRNTSTGVIGTDKTDAVTVAGRPVNIEVSGKGCRAYGNVIGKKDFIGGFTGLNEGIIEKSAATGKVEGAAAISYSVGGFVGENRKTIQICYAKGSVKGKQDVGGFAGSQTPEGTINLAYSVGNVSGTTNIGGFAGTNWGSVKTIHTMGSASAQTPPSPITAGKFAGFSSGTSLKDIIYLQGGTAIASGTDSASTQVSSLSAAEFKVLNNFKAKNWKTDSPNNDWMQKYPADSELNFYPVLRLIFDIPSGFDSGSSDLLIAYLTEKITPEKLMADWAKSTEPEKHAKVIKDFLEEGSWDKINTKITGSGAKEPYLTRYKENVANTFNLQSLSNLSNVDSGTTQKFHQVIIPSYAGSTYTIKDKTLSTQLETNISQQELAKRIVRELDPKVHAALGTPAGGFIIPVRVQSEAVLIAQGWEMASYASDSSLSRPLIDILTNTGKKIIINDKNALQALANCDPNKESGSYIKNGFDYILSNTLEGPLDKDTGDIMIKNSKKIGIREANFDGNGYAVKSFERALFGYIIGGTVKNLAVNADITIENTLNSGIFSDSVGSTDSAYGEPTTIIENVYSTGSMINAKDTFGGLIGDAYKLDLSNSYSTASVKGSWPNSGNIESHGGGGLIGYANSTTVDKSYANTASVDSSYTFKGWTSGTGGLIGISYWSEVKNSYAITDKITGYHNTGGIIGYATNTPVSNSYSQINTSLSGHTNVGGLIGYLTTAGTSTADVINSYSTGAGKVSGAENTGGAVGKVYSLGNKAVNIEDIYSNVNVTGRTCTGGLIGYVFANEEKGIVKIKESHSTSKITVSGVGSTITSIGGFIGEVSRHFNISDSYATGEIADGYNGSSYTSQYVGGFIGRIANGSTGSRITNSYANGNVTGSDYVGGFTGLAFSAEMANCYATGSVTSSSMIVGGFVGAVNSIKLSKSYSKGAVTSKAGWTGGFIGSMDNLSANSDVSQCYSTGKVITGPSDNYYNIAGYSYAGGFVGIQEKGSISDCYSTGDVYTPYYNYVGGFVGNQSNGSISNSYAISNITHIAYIKPAAGILEFGAFKGRAYGGISNSFYGSWKKDLTDPNNPADLKDNRATGLTEAQFKNKNIFTGWDGAIWDFSEVRPVLKNQKEKI